MDLDGITLSAVKGLIEVNKKQNEEIKSLKENILELIKITQNQQKQIDELKNK